MADIEGSFTNAFNNQSWPAASPGQPPVSGSPVDTKSIGNILKAIRTFTGGRNAAFLGLAKSLISGEEMFENPTLKTGANVLKDVAMALKDLDIVVPKLAPFSGVAGKAVAPLGAAAIIAESKMMIEDASKLAAKGALTSQQLEDYKNIVYLHAATGIAALSPYTAATLMISEGMVSEAYDDWLEKTGITDEATKSKLRPYSVLESAGFKSRTPDERRKAAFYDSLPETAGAKTPAGIRELIDLKNEITHEVARERMARFQSGDVLMISPANWSHRLDDEHALEALQKKFGDAYDKRLADGSITGWKKETVDPAPYAPAADGKIHITLNAPDQTPNPAPPPKM